MSTEDSLIQWLTEIRDVQREHLELYRKNSEATIAKQDQALNATRRFQRFYRIVVAVVLAALVLLMAWLFKH